MRKIFVMDLGPFDLPARPEGDLNLLIRRGTRSNGGRGRGDCSHAIAVVGAEGQDRLLDRLRDAEKRLPFEFHPNGEKSA